MAAATKDLDPKWHRKQVKEYTQERGYYKRYAETLKQILQAAAARYAPDSIVQAREKSLPSFAEKAARKRDKYDRPARQITDLCAARIVVYTQSQLRTLCQFVRDNFAIDEANSDDAAARLRPSEFGYRSVHFVVQVNAPEILGVKVPLRMIGERKAEIQVRTLLQHAWASITHDRLYKGPSGLPPLPHLERISARLAALLEDAEEVVEDFERGMQEYMGNYFAYLEPDKLRSELQIHQLVVALEKRTKRAPVALRLADLAYAAGDLDLAISALRGLRGGVPESLQVLADCHLALRLGSLLIERSRGNSADADFKEGMALLREAANPPKPGEEIQISFNREEEKLRSAAAARYADASSRVTTQQKEAPAFFNLALQRDPSDPYHLASLFQFRPVLTEHGQVSEAIRPALLQAIETCRHHVQAGLELPRAWLTMARFHCLLEQPYEALDNYAKAIHFYQGNPWREVDFRAEHQFLHRLHQAGFRGRLGWMEQLLQIAWAIKQGRAKDVETFVGRKRLHEYATGERVAIIAGGAAPELQSILARYKRSLTTALEDFNGAVIAGGTESGIPGCVGAVRKQLRRTGKARFTLVGYHPAVIPSDTRLDNANYCLYQIDSDDTNPRAGFSPAEPLQAWVDLLASEIEPAKVLVLGINGGPISHFEYALGLALGATVGVVESSGRQASRICKDADWSKVRRLLPLPDDAGTLHAFLHLPHNLTDGEVGTAQMDAMARKVHEIYLRDTRKDYKRPATLPWEYLPDDFVFSNRAQAAYAFHILRRFGYKVRVVGRVPSRGALTKLKHIEPMAEMEHGRWNVERLLRGWRYATKRDDDLKQSPYIVPWAQLPDAVRAYDRRTVTQFPEILAAGGYEITR